MKTEYSIFETEGFGGDDLLYFTPTSRCGVIKDGVALEHNNDGAWVIYYKDLLEMARLAKKARRKNKSKKKSK